MSNRVRNRGRAKGRKQGIGRKLSRRRFGERAPRACTPHLRARAPRTLPEVNDSVIAMGGGYSREWWKPSGVGPVCRVGEECARRAREQGEKEDRPAQESKPDPSSNASARSYGFSLERRIVAVAV